MDLIRHVLGVVNPITRLRLADSVKTISRAEGMLFLWVVNIVSKNITLRTDQRGIYTVTFMVSVGLITFYFMTSK